MARLEVLNPVAKPREQQLRMAPRLGGLEGKTIGLYWNMKAGGDAALERVVQALAARYPGVAFKNFIGSVGFIMRHCTAEDAARIAAQCDAVVGTTSD
ncbi:MAG: hypothetical protein HY683_04380 [Chloroflexi bacterium]|nr:hypothetical protein [Chloroflexota bacterium]